MCAKVQLVSLCVSLPTATRSAIRKSVLTLCFPLIFCFHRRSRSPTKSLGLKWIPCVWIWATCLCVRFKITKPVVAISLEEPSWCAACVSGRGGLMNFTPGASADVRRLSALPANVCYGERGEGQSHSSHRRTPVGSVCHSRSAANRTGVTTGQTLEVKSGPEEVNYSICVCVYKILTLPPSRSQPTRTTLYALNAKNLLPGILLPNPKGKYVEEALL